MVLSSEKKYEILVNLYKHYNDILLKGMGFAYAIISGLGTFYVAHSEKPYAKSVLVLSCIAALLSSYIFLMCRSLLSNLELEFKKTSDDLELTAYPSIKPLSLFLLVNAIVMLSLVVAGTIYFC